MDPGKRQAALRRTVAWVRDVIIGQSLCPFAREPVDAGRLRITVTGVRDPEDLVVELGAELDRLAVADAHEVETILLVHPNCLTDFLEYNDFLDRVDELLETKGLVGEVQVASFHPDYRFADTEPDAPENYTNRSPHPMLHLLREASVTRAVQGHPDVHGIPGRNVEHMRGVPREQLERWRRGNG